MSFRQNLRLGLNGYAEAHRFIAKHKLWLYVVLPGLINVILFLLTWSTGMHYADLAVEELIEWMGLAGKKEGVMGYIKGAAWFFLTFGFRILFILLYFSLYKYLILIIMSPILALLSEKVDELINGTKYPLNIPQLIKDIFRGIMIAVRNLFLELFFTFLFWLGSFIPLVGMAAPVGMFLVQSYYYGFSMMDYTNERLKMGVGESIRFINLHKGLAIANGSVFYLLFLIPFIGWMIAPAYGVVAATLSTLKVRKEIASAPQTY